MCLFLWQASFFPALVQGRDNPTNVKIVVQQGESLWGLAQSHHTTVDEILKLNKVKNPDHIRAGESLWVPNSAVEETSKKVEEIPKITEDKNVSGSFEAMKSVTEATDDLVSTSWWVNALRRRIDQIPSFVTVSKLGSFSPRLSYTQLKESIPTYEFFVNQETAEAETLEIAETAEAKTLDTPLKNTSADDDIDTVKKLTAQKTASIGAESQILSRSLGRLVSKEEVELLTRVIHGEARGEDFEGQVAVGAVVLNRLKDPRFPKTLRGVVYQSGAFTAVDDKQIHLAPDDQSYKAAEAALSGVDPSDGALFYFNPRIATDRWIKSRPVVKNIGNHTFSI